MIARPAGVFREIALESGEIVRLRPIRPDDEPLMVRFHEELSDLSVYLRYFHMMRLAERASHARLARICGADQDREVVVVAEAGGGGVDAPAILGVARLERTAEPGVAEFAVVVADRVQGRGVGSALMRAVIDMARAGGVSRVRADVLSANAGMRRLCARVGIPIRPTADPAVVVADLAL